MGGLDYRASPDWASRLGISLDGLAEYQLRAIDFLRDVAKPYEGELPDVLLVGIVGPRGDAYGVNRTITAGRPRTTTPSRSERCVWRASTS
jgi:hypothetical protein